MNRKTLRTIALTSFVLVVALGARWQSQAQDAKTQYPSMAPLDQYLMERNAEIALARSAGPESISRDAEVMVLGPHGYETAIQGKNGFVCMVQRSWAAPFDDPEFWNPKGRAQSASTRREPGPTFGCLSSRPIWYWQDARKLRSPRP